MVGMRRVLVGVYAVLSIYIPVEGRESEKAQIKAYYTRLVPSDQGYTGKYRDVVVELLGRGHFMFDADNGYRPYWKVGKYSYDVEELIPRVDSDTRKISDKFNICSNVAIVEKTDSFVVVHWRYVPDITTESFTDFKAAYNKKGNPSVFYAEFVDEYYRISVDGIVDRTVRPGCYSLDEWNDPGNRYQQRLVLGKTGIKKLEHSEPSLSRNYAQVVNSEILPDVGIADRVMKFNFDEAVSNGMRTTVEQVSNVSCPIDGVKAYWHKGVSGSCLMFDSYSNAVTMPTDQVPSLGNGSFSIDAWIAPQEYPFNTAAIVDHFNSENTGYFLGMNRQGELVFRIGDGTQLAELKSSRIPLYKWAYVVASYDADQDLMRIAINGLDTNSHVCHGFVDADATPLTIGMTRYCRQYPFGAEREITRQFKTNMVFSGLIDEVSIYGRVLTSDDIKTVISAIKPSMNDLRHSGLNVLRPYTLPASKKRHNAFGAYYTKLDYYPAWDGLWRVGEYADIEVEFQDEPWRFVFWRGTRYLPSLVTDYGYSGIWSNDQGPEVFPGLCYEHMSDMLCRFSNVRLIASSPARVVVHWRNASVNIAYQWPTYDDLGRGIWTDEYWTIYPDGTSVRHQQMYNPRQARVIEMNQNEILLHPGQTPENVVLDNAVATGDINGNIEYHSRLHASVAKEKEPAKKNMQYINLNSSTKQFQIGEIGTRIATHLSLDVFWNGWDHYPCQLIPSDGTAAVEHDRASSSCVATFREYRRNISPGVTEAMQIYGLTRKSPEQLTTLNRAWNFAPNGKPKKGCRDITFVKSEKAYYITAHASDIQFDIEASKEAPMENVALVIQNFDGRIEDVCVSIDNNQISCAKGIEFDTKGRPQLVLWIEKSAIKPVSLGIKWH